MINKLAPLTQLPFFRISHVEMLLSHLKKESIYQQITRWIHDGKVIQLKKGYYVMQEYIEKHRVQDEYRYYIANILRQPSYVSGVTILQYYDILTELTYPITSITTKTTRTYNNALGDFRYASIKKPLYKGYVRRLYGQEPIYIATKAKALFDYLYIKYNRAAFMVEEIKERERLNLENFTAKEKKEFIQYCLLAHRSILLELSKKIFND